MRKIKVLIGWDRNYSAGSEDVPGCIATGNSLEDIKKGFASALEFHLKGMRQDGDEIPNILDGQYELEFELNVRAEKHYLSSINE